MLNFSANLGFLWPDRPLLDRIDAAAAAGFRAIELHWPQEESPEAVRALCKRLGLRLLGLNTPPGERSKGEFGLAALPGRRKDFERGFAETLAWARAAGATAIHVMAGNVASEDRAAAHATLVENLAAAAQAAPDMTLLLEALNGRDAPGYFYSTVDAVAAIIAEVGANNIKLMFDVYHVGVVQDDILVKLERHLPLIGHVQIAAVPSRAEPDEGDIAYPAIFAALEQIGYRGWIGCEYRPRGDTDLGLAWVRKFGLTL
jgi:hydroxypyruvate isomerase